MYLLNLVAADRSQNFLKAAREKVTYLKTDIKLSNLTLRYLNPIYIHYRTPRFRKNISPTIFSCPTSVDQENSISRVSFRRHTHRRICEHM